MLKYPSPIHDTANDTHTSLFDEVIELLLNQSVQQDPGLEFMIATHNMCSLRSAVWYV